MVDYGTACGANSAKPDGWRKPAYPRCNRPSGHHPPHREYDPMTARVLYEWWEAMDLSDRDLRSALKRAAATERRRLYGTTGR